jgi:two-component system, chemotaxis family, chemotaxis protein CheY
MMAFNLLIVDDSITTRTMIKRTLGMAQIPVGQCFEAANGKAGLEMLARQKVDLVLADLHMPEMTGVEMTRCILSNPATKDIPVLLVTAEPSMARLNELLKAGARGCIRKPFTPEKLRAAIQNVLGAIHA